MKPVPGTARLRTARAIVAGVIGTIVVTALWLLEPAVGLPRLAVGQILSHFLAVVTGYYSAGPALGWTIHLLFGIVLALVYAGGFVSRVRGTPVLRGLFYGGIIFVVAQLVFAPLVGAGIFSRGDLPMLAGSLLGHALYGSLVGAIYGVPKVA